jgi:hypothetical protein
VSLARSRNVRCREPGVGKTVLLNAATEAASAVGVRILRAAGVKFEAETSFSGLNQVLLPLLGALAELTAVHCNALNVELGFGDGTACETIERRIFQRPSDRCAGVDVRTQIIR